MACLMDCARETLSQVMLLEPGGHAHISWVSACTKRLAQVSFSQLCLALFRFI